MAYSLPETGLLLRGNNVDESAYRGAVSLQGAAWVAGADPFGGYALDTSAGSARLPRHALINPGTSDFTLEIWCKPRSLASSNLAFLGKSGTPGYGNISAVIVNGSAGIVVGNGNSWVNVNGYYGGSVPLNEWSYLEFTRVGSTVKAAINSVDVVSYSVGSANLSPILPGDVLLGINDYQGSSMPFIGLLGPMRYTCGVALRGSGGPLPVPTENFPPLPPMVQIHSSLTVVAQDEVPRFSFTHSRASLALDTEFGGKGRYPFKVEGLPSSQKAKVSLLRARDKVLAREMWSAADGTGTFTGLDVATKFIAVAQDPSGLLHPCGAEHFPELPDTTGGV